MRVDIAYFEGYPELVTELEKFSPRARAERMRFLAALGLSCMRREDRSFSSDNADKSTQTPSAQIKPSNVPKQIAPSPVVRPTVATGESDMANRITRGVFGQVD